MSELACWFHDSVLGDSQNAWYAFHAVVIIGLVAAIAWIDTRGQRTSFRLPTGLVVFLLFATAIVLCWMPNFARQQINPDEDQWIALANSFSAEPANFLRWFAAFNTQRELTLAPLVVGSWISGGDLGYGGARLVGALLWSVFAACIYACVANAAGRQAGLWSSCCLVVLICFLSCWDYIAYNSELPVIVLCAAAMALFCSAAGKADGAWQILATGFLLACIPFAKKQGIPLGVALAAVFLIFLIVRGEFAKLRWLCLGALLGAGLFFTFYVLSGNLGGVLYAQRVLNEYAQQGFPGSDRSWLRGLLNVREMLVRDELRPLFLGALLATPVLLWSFFRERNSWSGTRSLVMWSGVATLGAALFAVWFPGNLFHHYALLLVFPCSLLVGSALGMIFRESAHRSSWSVAYVVILLSLLAIYRKDGHEGVREMTRDCGPLRQSPLTAEILDVSEPGDRMMVWGWWPAYFIETRLMQGARWMYPQFATGSFANTSSVVRDYVQDLETLRPKLIVEWVGSDAIHFKDPAVHGIESAPEITAYLHAHYDLVKQVGNRKLYLRKE